MSSPRAWARQNIPPLAAIGGAARRVVPAMRAGAADPHRVGSILLVVGLSERRILNLRIVRETTAMTVRANSAPEPTPQSLDWLLDDSIVT
jgi:hypothetical protein